MTKQQNKVHVTETNVISIKRVNPGSKSLMSNRGNKNEASDTRKQGFRQRSKYIRIFNPIISLRLIKNTMLSERKKKIQII